MAKFSASFDDNATEVVLGVRKEENARKVVELAWDRIVREVGVRSVIVLVRDGFPCDRFDGFWLREPRDV